MPDESTRPPVEATIAALPGDGVGPEVLAEGLRVLAAVGERYGHGFTVQHALIGGAAIDATGEALPAGTRTVVARADAVLLGAVGGPRWDGGPVRPESGLLALRRMLGTYANIRPVRMFDAGKESSPLRPDRLEGVDLVVVRELTGGLYYGEKERRTRADGVEVASDSCVYTSEEVARVVRVAATIAMTRRRTLTSVDKANVLATSRLWRDVATRVVREEFPELALEHMLVDACAMHLVRQPSRFDVIVTENLFGDILTDEASVIAGSIGLLPSASLGDADPRRGGRRVGLYEPIHGSAPDIAGRGLANPTGMILSVAMMLRDSLGLVHEADVVERAVEATLDEGWRTGDLSPVAGRSSCSTSEMGVEVARRVTRAAVQDARTPVTAPASP